MSWDWWTLSRPVEPDSSGALKVKYDASGDLTVYDAETGKLVPAKREVTVARSTRAMPGRKR